MVENFLIAILEGDKVAPLILADYLEETFSTSREAAVYAKRLREDMIPFTDLVAIIHHFGSSEIKKRIRKARKLHKQRNKVKGLTRFEFEWALGKHRSIH